MEAFRASSSVMFGGTRPQQLATQDEGVAWTAPSMAPSARPALATVCGSLVECHGMWFVIKYSIVCAGETKFKNFLISNDLDNLSWSIAKSKSGKVMSCAWIDFLQIPPQSQHPAAMHGILDGGTLNFNPWMKSSRVNIFTSTQAGRPDKIPNIVAPHGAPSLIGSGLDQRTRTAREKKKRRKEERRKKKKRWAQTIEQINVQINKEKQHCNK